MTSAINLIGLFLLVSLKSGVALVPKYQEFNSTNSCKHNKEFTQATCVDFELGAEFSFAPHLDKLSFVNVTGDIGLSTFEAVSNLTYLSIAKSRIGRVAGRSLAALPHLVFLVVYGNGEFPDFDKDMFDGTTINWLSLIANNNSIKEDAFHFLQNLTWLHLQNQHLENLTAVLLNNTNKLRELSVINCGLHVISVNAFEHVGDLEILSLNFNKINAFQVGTFRSLDKLRVLELHHNPVGHYGFDQFAGLMSVEVLGLPSRFLGHVNNADEIIATFPNLKKFEVKKRDHLHNKTRILLRQLRGLNIHIVGTPHDSHLPPLHHHYKHKIVG